MCVCLSGCGGYREFSLPKLNGDSALRLRVNLAKEPALPRGSARDVLNPSVVHEGGTYRNYYSEFDGRVWRTALATSTDGHSWTKQGRMLEPTSGSWEGDYIAANGSALVRRGTWWYWYQAGGPDVPRVGLARSADGRTWRKEPSPVIELGPRGSWDERGIADPWMFTVEGRLYAYYLGQNRARQQQIGLARSDDGVHWTKLRSNPVLTIPWPGSGAPDENGLGEPAVWQAQGWYWMLYTGRAATEERSLIAARSLDGVHWIRQKEAFQGTAAWNRKVVCDPSVLSERGRIRLWFGGGDVARPDENVNGQIGEGEIVIQKPEAPAGTTN